MLEGKHGCRHRRGRHSLGISDESDHRTVVVGGCRPVQHVCSGEGDYLNHRPDPVEVLALAEVGNRLEDWEHDSNIHPRDGATTAERTEVLNPK